MRRLRVVMPPWWAMLAVAVFWGGLNVFVICTEWQLGLRSNTFVEKEFFTGLMAPFVIAYAIYRVLAFHPALRTSYYAWLDTTPWTSRKPLPLGPVHLTWQDLVFLGVAVALCWSRSGAKSLILVQVFLAVYLALLCFLHASTGQKYWAYAVAAGIGLMGFWALSPLFYVGAGATYVAAVLGLRRSLASFPWRDLPSYLLARQHFVLGAKPKTKEQLGWPFDRLAPGFSDHYPQKLGDSILTGLLAGWWVFILSYHEYLAERKTDGIIVISFAILVLGVSVRILIYCHGYAPPLSIFGRVALGRLIIPGYDKVFVAPMLAVLAFSIARMLPYLTGMSNVIALPIGVTAMWWILFGMGPSLLEWRLTGNHRIVKGLVATAGQSNR